MDEMIKDAINNLMNTSEDVYDNCQYIDDYDDFGLGDLDGVQIMEIE